MKQQQLVWRKDRAGQGGKYKCIKLLPDHKVLNGPKSPHHTLNVCLEDEAAPPHSFAVAVYMLSAWLLEEPPAPAPAPLACSWDWRALGCPRSCKMLFPGACKRV